MWNTFRMINNVKTTTGICFYLQILKGGEMNIILVRKRKQALHNIQFAINSGIRESK